MNEIIKSLYNRKSMRVYEEKSIPQEMKKVILEAAAQAPTAGCQQLYTILDITDEELKKALSETCDYQPFIAKAPMVLVFCADCKKWYDAYLEAGCEPRKPGIGDLMLAVTDTAIAAQNAVVATCLIMFFQLLCWYLVGPPSSKRIALNPRDVHRNILSMRIPTAVWTTLNFAKC